MRMDIDKSRHQATAVAVDRPPGVASGQLPDGDDPIAADSDVGDIRIGARAIDHGDVQEQQIVDHRHILRPAAKSHPLPGTASISCWV
ncbi:hypothetical protein [Lonsdalea populi]|uniref:hypothetical protein n=1 Tax=Lonsdalea populi TaxID=1172565 RepID=UPI001E5A04D2|nr:hypothetical protein [Lonsdalea populi]